MILKRQNMSENKWNHFKIVPQGHNNCQLSTVNCQFPVPLRSWYSEGAMPATFLKVELK